MGHACMPLSPDCHSIILRRLSGKSPVHGDNDREFVLIITCSFLNCLGCSWACFNCKINGFNIADSDVGCNQSTTCLNQSSSVFSSCSCSC